LEPAMLEIDHEFECGRVTRKFIIGLFLVAFSLTRTPRAFVGSPCCRLLLDSSSQKKKASLYPGYAASQRALDLRRTVRSQTLALSSIFLSSFCQLAALYRDHLLWC